MPNPTRLDGIPDYRNLGGDAQAAAERMEARAREPASAAMFDALIRPLLVAGTRRILEVGGGTGGLARKVATAAPDAEVHLTDKSPEMLAAARTFAGDTASRTTSACWDATDEPSFPFSPAPYDLILSSVMVPYLSDEETTDLVRRLAKRLRPGGTLCFLEQDLQTDALAFPDFELLHRVFAKDARKLKQTLALNLRPLLRDAGLSLLAARSFLWTDETYGPYLRDLLGKLAADAERAGRMTAEERARWLQTLEDQRSAGDFHYSLVYHRVAGASAVSSAETAVGR